jgi:hypothetical protein
LRKIFLPIDNEVKTTDILQSFMRCSIIPQVTPLRIREHSRQSKTPQVSDRSLPAGAKDNVDIQHTFGGGAHGTFRSF